MFRSGGGSDETKRAAASVESKIAERLQDENGLDAEASCSEDFELEEHASFPCVATLAGEEINYEVTIAAVAGNRFRFDAENQEAILPVDALANKLVAISDAFRTSPDLVDCEGRDDVIIRAPEEIVECTMVVLGGVKQTHRFAVRSTDGHLAWFSDDSARMISELAESITVAQLTRETRVAVQAACEEPAEVERGVTFPCTATLEGQEVPFQARVAEFAGDQNYIVRFDVDLQNRAAIILVEKVLEVLVDQGLPRTATDSVDCESKDTVIVRAPGETFQCTGVATAEQEKRGTLTFTVRDTSGRITSSQRGGGGNTDPPPSGHR